MGWLALVAKKKSSNDRWLVFTQTQPEQHTHRGQYNISREYYYETFKPPLSGRISIRCPTTTLTLWIFFFFLRLNPGTRRKFLPHQQGKVCVGFSFLCHIWLRLRCRRLFVSLHCVWSKSPPSDSLNNAHCTTGCTHFQDFSRSGTISVVEKATTTIITIILNLPPFGFLSKNF